MRYSSNALLAKSRAKHGKMLKDSDYDDLASCKSVSQATMFLRDRTKYSDVFNDLTLSAMQRFNIEYLLKKHLLKAYESLFRYEFSIGNDFYKLFITEYDITVLITCIFLLGSDKEGYILSPPVFYSRHSDFNISKVITKKTFSALLDALQSTPYYDLLNRYVGVFPSDLARHRIESDLKKYKHKVIHGLIKSNLKGDAAKEAANLYTTKSDLEHIVDVYRINNLTKKEEKFYPEIDLEFSALSKKDIDKLKTVSNIKELSAVLSGSNYKKLLSLDGFEFIEDAVDDYLYRYYKKKMLYSNNPYSVMICYLFLSQYEIVNITRAIEGIRYGLTPEDVKKNIIGI